MILLRGSTRNLTETNQKLFRSGARNQAGKPSDAAGLGTCVVWGAGYCAVVNPAAQLKVRTAFTLIELLVVVAIVFILLATAWPTHKGVKVRASQNLCKGNLRQIGLGLILYAQDNKGRFPWQVSTNQGGTEELISSGAATDHYLKLTQYLRSPRHFVCPTDTNRFAATNFATFDEENLSYFLALNASTNPAQAILAGDRHLIVNQQPVKRGLLGITNRSALSWSTELHFTQKEERQGVLAFGDGSCEVVAAKNLSEMFQRRNLAILQLMMP